MGNNYVRVLEFVWVWQTEGDVFTVVICDPFKFSVLLFCWRSSHSTSGLLLSVQKLLSLLSQIYSQFRLSSAFLCVEHKSFFLSLPPLLCPCYLSRIRNSRKFRRMLIWLLHHFGSFYLGMFNNSSVFVRLAITSKSGVKVRGVFKSAGG